MEAEEEEPVMKGETHGGSSEFLLPQDCVEDAVSPIILRLNFSLAGDAASSKNLRPVLAVGSQDHTTASVSSYQWSPRDRMATSCLHMLNIPQEILTVHHWQ